MKTTKLFLKVIVGALMILTVAACSKDKGSNNNNAYAYNNGQYIMQGGICISRTTGQPVQTTLCQTGSGLYTMNQMNQCISTQTGQIVDPTLCYQNGGGAGYGQQCVGWFSTLDGYQQGQCVQSYGTPYNNCSGNQLRNLQTGQIQYCP